MRRFLAVLLFIPCLARAGDAKAALEILKHAHGWVAKQAIEVNQTISVKHALELAEKRVLEYTLIEADDAATSTGLLTTQLEGQADGYTIHNASHVEKSTDV